MLNAEYGTNSIRLLDRCIKRLFDIIVASLLIILLSPIFVLVSLLVKFTSPGPIVYKQKRVGKDGVCFFIYKYRSMYQNADKIGPFVTSSDDKRITPLGKWMRSSKLDELPQLFNVLRGDMSLVGPRPQVPKYVDLFQPDLRKIVLMVRPGITGPTALRFRNEEQILADKTDRENYYIQQILPVKLELDAEYVQARSIIKDMGILIKTIAVLSGSVLKKVYVKAYSGNENAQLYTLNLRKSPDKVNVNLNESALEKVEKTLDLQS